MALGLLLPLSEKSMEVFGFLQKLIINIGMYSIFPLVFFSMGIGIFELKKDGKVLSFTLRIILYLIITTVFMALLGVISVQLFSPDLIPDLKMEPADYKLMSLSDYAFSAFPENTFSIFSSKGFYMLPIYLFAFALGLNFSFDKVVTRPAVQLFDSLSRILFNLNKYIVEFLSIGMIILTAFFFFQIRSAKEISLFKQLILLFAVNSVIIIFGLLPLLTYFLGKKENPYKLLYGSVTVLTAAFFSGNSYFTLPLISRTGKKNIGIPRKAGALSYPLFVMFGRAGTAMITGISFILVIKSYSSMYINFNSLLWTCAFSILISFLTGAIPANGTFFAVAIMCSLFSPETEKYYLILKPAIPLLISFSALIDSAVMVFATALASKHEKMLEEREIKDFV